MNITELVIGGLDLKLACEKACALAQETNTNLELYVKGLGYNVGLTIKPTDNPETIFAYFKRAVKEYES
jgi:hypothetical protein